MLVRREVCMAFKRKIKTASITEPKPFLEGGNGDKYIKEPREPHETVVITDPAKTGRPTREEYTSLLATIDDLRLKGHPLTSVSTQVKKDLLDVRDKIAYLERLDATVGLEAKPTQKKREIDLQYLLVMRKLHEIADAIDEKSVVKIECYKVIKDLVGLRSKLWQVDAGTPNVNIKMGNVENVVLGGNIDKRKLNLIGDLLAGKISEETLMGARKEVELLDASDRSEAEERGLTEAAYAGYVQTSQGRDITVSQTEVTGTDAREGRGT